MQWSLYEIAPTLIEGWKITTKTKRQYSSVVVWTRESPWNIFLFSLQAIIAINPLQNGTQWQPKDWMNVVFYECLNSVSVVYKDGPWSVENEVDAKEWRENGRTFWSLTSLNWVELIYASLSTWGKPISKSCWIFFWWIINYYIWCLLSSCSIAATRFSLNQNLDCFQFAQRRFDSFWSPYLKFIYLFLLSGSAQRRRRLQGIPIKYI